MAGRKPTTPQKASGPGAQEDGLGKDLQKFSFKPKRGDKGTAPTILSVRIAKLVSNLSP